MNITQLRFTFLNNHDVLFPISKLNPKGFVITFEALPLVKIKEGLWLNSKKSFEIIHLSLYTEIPLFILFDQH